MHDIRVCKLTMLCVSNVPLEMLSHRKIVAPDERQHANVGRVECDDVEFDAELLSGILQKMGQALVQVLARLGPAHLKDFAVRH